MLISFFSVLNSNVMLGQGCLRTLFGEPFISTLIKVGLRWVFVNGPKWALK